MLSAQSQSAIECNDTVFRELDVCSDYSLQSARALVPHISLHGGLRGVKKWRLL